jgi:ATP-dependent DNA helicase RecQ
VVDDIRSQLGDSIEVVRGPLIRKSLRLQNLDIPNPIDRYSAIVQILGQIDGSGIIYTLTVNDTIRLTRWLKENGFAAHAYYSDLDKKDKTLRARLEQRLINNDLKVIVATVALGMGFDKPDLAFVIHFQRPSSVVSYYQQVGRAGRSVDEAYGILMGGAEDDDIANYFIRAAFPPQTHVNEVLLALRNSNRSSRYALEPLVNLSRAQIEKTLKFLAAENPSPITKIGSNYIALPASLSYRVDDAHIQNITAIRRNEQVEMQSYMRHEACLMRFLSEALDDPDASDCGKCSGCLGKPLLQKEIDSDIQQKAANFLGRTYQKIKPRLQKPVGTFEVFSKMSNNQSNFSRELCCEEGRALCVWGDPGWGQLVRTGKYPPPGGTMGFDDRLVEACAEMLTDWKPWPEPTWVTAIPSLRHPDLVPDFARRIATRLGLPYVDAIVKTRQGERQRDMENSAHQIANLDGSLKLASSELPKGAVLLIDDMVDSKWTFTIAGYLLRQAKIAAVFPLALALNSVADT